MTITTIDPLGAFMAARLNECGQLPVPLERTQIDLAVRGAFALVTMRRLFRNRECSAIEAALTFPVPVDAVVFALEARIGERVLHGVAQPREKARETYEEAIDDGLAAVLHEELMPGIHMVSVGNLGSGDTVEVTARWAMQLTPQGERSHLRLPLTVGQVYGQSPLAQCDDLLGGGKPDSATLRIDADRDCAIGDVILREGTLEVPLGAAVDLSAPTVLPDVVAGEGADGAALRITCQAAPGGSAPLSLAVLVDRSGSMEAPCGTYGSLHDAVRRGLASLTASFAADDRIALWQFNNGAEQVGAADRAADWADAVAQLKPPQGGTEIGRALDRAAAEEVRDLLLITDGKSHALDVHALAAKATRVSVVLIGSDSLEANVGYLAALTGGDLFIAAGADTPGAIAAAIAQLRAPVAAPRHESDGALHWRRNGLDCRVLSGEAAAMPEARPLPGDWPRAIGALAAARRLRALPRAEATALACAEGLVSHLTSLVLVDHAGAVQQGLPAFRKVALAEIAEFRETRVAYCVDDSASPSVGYFLNADIAADARPAEETFADRIAPFWFGNAGFGGNEAARLAAQERALDAIRLAFAQLHADATNRQWSADHAVDLAQCLAAAASGALERPGRLLMMAYALDWASNPLKGGQLPPNAEASALAALQWLAQWSPLVDLACELGSAADELAIAVLALLAADDRSAQRYLRALARA